MKYIVLGVEGLGACGGSGRVYHAPPAQLMAGVAVLFGADAPGGAGGAARPWEVCRHLLEVVLIRLSRRGDLSLGAEEADSRTSRECGLVRRYIDNHFKENLSLGQLA